MVSLIAYDLDGTLIDSRLDLAGAVNAMRAEMGLEPLNTERIVSFVGNGIKNLVRRSVADTEVDFETAYKRMRNYYADHLVDSTALYPGVSAGLRELKNSGIKQVVISNKAEDATCRILKLLGVIDCFDAVVGGDAAYPLKPEPDSLLAMAAKFGATPGSAWMFGDGYTDLEAARRAGFRSALARYGFGDPREEKSDFQVDSFPEFVMAIKGF